MPARTRARACARCRCASCCRTRSTPTPTTSTARATRASVADKRTDQFARAKRFKCSLAEDQGQVAHHARYEAGSQARYHVPCPHCQHLQWLRGADALGDGAAPRARVHRVRRASPRSTAAPPARTPASTARRASSSRERTRASRHRGARARLVRVRALRRRDRRAPQDRDAGGVARRPGAPHPRGARAGEVLADDDPDPHAIWAMVRGELKRFRPRYTRPLSGTCRRCIRRSAGSPGRRRSSSTSRREGRLRRGDRRVARAGVLEHRARRGLRGPAGEQPKVNILRQRAEAATSRPSARRRPDARRRRRRPGRSPRGRGRRLRRRRGVLDVDFQVIPATRPSAGRARCGRRSPRCATRLPARERPDACASRRWRSTRATSRRTSTTSAGATRTGT
jgi:hypothetical protein